MRKISTRIPEGGAIEDSSGLTMEQYSSIMKKKLGKEYNRFAENVIARLNPETGSRVLEIGPGPGWAGISLVLKRRDLSLDGLEISSDMIRVAEDNATRVGLHGSIRYIQAAAEEMKPISDKQYDLVISRDSMHHWDDPEKVFLQICRVIKVGGKVYIHDHRRDLNGVGRLMVGVMGPLVAGKMARYWRSSIAAAYTRDEIEKLLERAHCKNWKVENEWMDLVIIKE